MLAFTSYLGLDTLLTTRNEARAMTFKDLCFVFFHSLGNRRGVVTNSVRSANLVGVRALSELESLCPTGTTILHAIFAPHWYRSMISEKS